jgi:hypothetical protein
LLEDIAEQQDVATEIAAAISSPVGLQADDEDDLLKELEEMEKVCSIVLLPYINFLTFEG